MGSTIPPTPYPAATHFHAVESNETANPGAFGGGSDEVVGVFSRQADIGRKTVITGLLPLVALPFLIVGAGAGVPGVATARVVLRLHRAGLGRRWRRGGGRRGGGGGGGLDGRGRVDDQRTLGLDPGPSRIHAPVA
jgi:hypothetical protein